VLLAVIFSTALPWGFHRDAIAGEFGVCYGAFLLITA